jgi:hypothetical protein
MWARVGAGAGGAGERGEVIKSIFIWVVEAAISPERGAGDAISVCACGGGAEGDPGVEDGVRDEGGDSEGEGERDAPEQWSPEEP